MSIPGITLVFKRSSAQEADLQQLLASQQNPSSPLYHQWLTPDTFATRFGMADEDIAAAQTWLQSNGFHIENTARSRDRITFSGTAAQVQSAFGTDLHYYQVDGEQHFAPAADLTLPNELAAVTAAILHLSNFRPKPNIKVQTRPKPDYTTPSTQAHYLGPQDIATMYDLKALYQNGFKGSGVALAVVGQSYVDTSSESKINSFRIYSGPIVPITPVLVPGSGVEAISPGDQGESEIDLEYSSSIAPGANVFFVFVGASQNYDIFDALSFAIDQNIAPVISISYGLCESIVSVTDLDQGNALFEQASAQGQTLVAASGDSGSTACAQYTSAGLSLTQEQALSVLYPADSPYVTAVGGTQMAAGTFAPGSSTYWESSGLSTPFGTLLSYVPEVVWNEGSPSFGIAASGGGGSAHFTRPTWQSGVPGIPSGAFRLLPDIALQSSITSPGFLLCTNDPTLARTQTSCSNGLEDSSGNYTVAGGTSFATPIFAGFLAILNQIEQTNGLGNINSELYSLASNSASYAAVFHDITSGSNACISGTGNCAAPGESGFAATSGYDEATGLGSVDFGQLATAWTSTSNTALTPTSIQLILDSVSASPGQTIQAQIIVGYFNGVSPNGQYFAPTGTLSVSVDHAITQFGIPFSETNQAVSNATAIYNVIAPATSGSHLITVTYTGDATHLPAVATSSIMVGNVTATGSFTVNASNLTVANGSQGSIPISATPAGGYSGRVAWSLAATTTNGTAEVCYFISPSSSNPNAATLNIGVGSICSSTAPSERSNFRTLASQASSKKENSPPWRNSSGFIVCASLIACGSLFTRRRKLSPSLWLVIVLITAASLGISGCGGSGGSGGGSSGGTGNTTPPPNAMTYTLTLTGKDSVNTAITASTNFTLTVN